jgi:hypothetical protein
MARLRQRDAPRAGAGHPGADLGPAGAVRTPSPACAPPRQDHPAHPGAAASLTRKAIRPAPPIQWPSRSTSSSTGGQQDGCAAGHEILDLLPQVYGERGSRPVAGSSRMSTGGWPPGWRPGPAAAACRRDRSGPTGRRRRPAGTAGAPARLAAAARPGPDGTAARPAGGSRARSASRRRPRTGRPARSPAAAQRRPARCPDRRPVGVTLDITPGVPQVFQAFARHS